MTRSLKITSNSSFLKSLHCFFHLNITGKLPQQKTQSIFIMKYITFLVKTSILCSLKPHYTIINGTSKFSMNPCLTRHIEGEFTYKYTFQEGKKGKKKYVNKFLSLFSVILRTAKGRNHSCSQRNKRDTLNNMYFTFSPENFRK